MADALPEEILSAEIDGFLGPEEEEPALNEEDGEEQEDGAEENEPETEKEGEEGEEEGGEEDAVAEPAPDMPKSWSKEDAKVWAGMTPEQKAVVNRRETERDRYLAKTGFEASQTRQQVENQAREVIAQLQDNHVAALRVYAQQFGVEPPDQRLLYTGDNNDVLVYQRQEAAFRQSQAQQQQLQQQIEQAQAQANLVRTQAQQAELASDAQRLKEQLPEWFDPSDGPKLQQSLQSIGSELGYPAELMAQASSVDILALRQASIWKAGYDKYKKLEGAKMEAVRAAKGLPKMARPGVKPDAKQASATATQKAWDNAKKSTGRDRESHFAEWAEKSGLI